MLKYLHIENIAVIEQTDIEFKSGFNVLTGETGAGKSIVIDSINAVLGERTSKDLIRAGCSEALVSALFGELDDKTVLKLKEFDISPDEDGNILVSRKLSLNGKGLIKINGLPFTASVLKEVSSFLINIHGQHDNQRLLNAEHHFEFLDAIAENEKEKTEYYLEFKNLNAIRRSLQELETDEDAKERKIDLLKYQINELKSADIKIGEIESLKKKLEIAENAETTLKALNTANTLLYGDENTDGITTLLKAVSKQLSLLKGESFEENYNKINNILSETEDVADFIGSALSSGELQNINADSINERLDLLYKLMIKYGNTEEDMLSFLENAEKELDEITFSDRKVAELSAMLEASKEKLILLADKLSSTRKNAAIRFETEVTDVLKELNMPSVSFKVDIKDGRYTKQGRDIVEFLISANAGEALKPLAKIASGGELSRTMLAIKSALSDKDSIPTMIFDEIDTGISGFAADKVGTQLKRVSDNKQVICVTHLAQIAARGDNHLLIEKSSNNGRTYTAVKSLSYEERISEIARIMSGTEITENLYNSAKELLDRSL
ncbi:MAG: DNA repair protein RecN [Clostridia bacterium]|nr:DNA repair protein RecN [Clostridia bacterium]